MVTYNHARFVEEAVRGALAQEVPYPFEVVVADDCSTDGTADIVARLAREHPDRIRLVEHEHRLGVLENVLSGYGECRGEYLALLDGDDYWLSPYKLQRQVEFLDRHAECAMCFHNALTVHEDGRREDLAFPVDWKVSSGLEDLLIENVIPSSSVMYRNGLIDGLPEWAGDPVTWDWALHLAHAQRGRIGYLPDAMTVMRRHGDGLLSTSTPAVRVQAALQMFEQFNRHLDGKYSAVIRASMSRWQNVAKVEELNLDLKRLETEWRRQVEQLQLERATAVNAIWARFRESERDREQLAAEVQRVTADRERVTAEKELALREIAELRGLVDEQRDALVDLRMAIEANATKEESVTSETMRGLATVDQRLSEIYRWMDVQRTRDLVHAVVPAGAVVLVVSKGDAELLRFEHQTGWHFPRTDDGEWAGGHPADSEAATRLLEELRAKGAQYLAFPGSSLWWLEHYEGFARHLEERYRPVLRREGSCVIFALADRSGAAEATPVADRPRDLALR